jgi:uncharacterized membrane protein
MDLDNVTGRQVLSGVLGVVLVLGALGLVYYAVAPVPATPGDTAFYVVNESDTAAGYPTNVSVGEVATVVVGIENAEGEQLTYEFVVTTGDRRLDRRSVTLGHRDTWRESLNVSFEESGEQRVRLRLYRDGGVDGEPYRKLRLVFRVASE